MLYEQGKNIGQTKDMKMDSGETSQVVTSSRIILGSEFDSMIAQIKSKAGEENISTKDILSFFNTNKYRHPFKKEQN